MTIFLLIRHGENDYLKKGLLAGNTPGIHLNERGRQQAVMLSESLASLPIRAVYASPLIRAVETASPLAKALGLEISLRPALADIDVGEWTGRKLSQLSKLAAWSQVQEKPSMFRFPGGDSFQEVQQRYSKEMELLSSRHGKNDLLAIFFHSDPIKLVISCFLGLPLDNFQKLTVDTGSVSVVKTGNQGSRLIALNLKPPFSLEL
jgi:probable phosphomutase (TIGR03848 family)